MNGWRHGPPSIMEPLHAAITFRRGWLMDGRRFGPRFTMAHVARVTSGHRASSSRDIAVQYELENLRALLDRNELPAVGCRRDHGPASISAMRPSSTLQRHQQLYGCRGSSGYALNAPVSCPMCGSFCARRIRSSTARRVFFHGDRPAQQPPCGRGIAARRVTLQPAAGFASERTAPQQPVGGRVSRSMPA